MKVTIITTVFNGETTLEKTIQSVLSQNYSELEYLVIDGASTDHSFSIAKKYSGVNCSVISEPDRGFYDALNKGIALASGDVIGILNADDVYVNKEVITDVMSAFVHDPQLDCVYGDLNYVRVVGDQQTIVRRWISSEFTPKKLYLGWMPPHPTLFLRKQVYERVGIFDLHYKISGDYDFILRSFKNKSFKAKYINKLMVNMQLGGLSNRSYKNIIFKMIEDYKILGKNQFPRIITLALKNISKLDQFIRR